MQVGSIAIIPVGTRINTGNGQIKATREFKVTVQDVQTTRAGNIKVFWRGHRSTKSAVLK